MNTLSMNLLVNNLELVDGDKSIDEKLSSISEYLHAAEQYLNNLRRASADIANSGMYPAVPSEQWQDRGGESLYLYMIFRTDGTGQYEGPGGARKLYVGNKPLRIAEARRLAENRHRYETIQSCIEALERWIALKHLEITSLFNGINQYPKTTCALFPVLWQDGPGG